MASKPALFYRDKEIVVYDDVISSDICKTLIDMINKNTPPQQSSDKQKYLFNGEFLHEAIHNAIKEFKFTGHDDWIPSHINHEWRGVHGYAKYSMNKHYDERVIEDLNTVSFYTIMFYLNNQFDDSGKIVFTNKKLEIAPKAGRLIMFNTNQLHSAQQASQDKYFIRSELMFKRKHCKTEFVEKELLALKYYKDYQKHQYSDVAYAMECLENASSTSTIIDDLLFG